jgi:arylsulfatase A-like enzyme
MYEESFRTPMLMRYPGKIKPGTKFNDFVMNLDIGPTILAAAGIKIPTDMQGQSILPVVDKQFKRDAMYYHYYERGEHNVSPHFGVRNQRYKLIRFYGKVNSWELFDLNKDKNELKNLYGNTKYTKVVEEMKTILMKEILKYDDQDALKIINEKI